MLMSNHPFHMVSISPWPILCSISVMNLLFSMVNWFFLSEYLLIINNLFTLCLVLYQWTRDVVRESTFQGFHTLFVCKFLKFSMILFILSELFFFVSFFWMYFHMAISPNIDVGMFWPPLMIEQFNPYDIPLLNSIILISSGMTVSWSHYCLLNSNLIESKISLLMTIILGVYFTIIQYIEYDESMFCINDSVFSSAFYMMTGFHGLHVIIGTILLLIAFMRLELSHFTSIHHFNFEAALWYWHFVDVIWLFLYIFIYWWLF